MCGRYSFSKPINEITVFFNFDRSLNITPRYNIAPSQLASVIVNENSVKVVDLYKWGLIPVWAKDPKIGNKTINARVETVEEKRSYKRLIKTHRCLVLSDGFNEWKKDPVSKQKAPMRILLKSEEPFAFAGLWDKWKDAEGEETYSFTILTSSPNDLIKEIHNRMPVILRRENQETWLDPDISLQEITSLNKPYPDDEMKTYTVSKRVNSPRFDMPECIQPVA